MNPYPSIKDIVRFLEAWAPKAIAESYDNVGLQLGDAQRSVAKALVALDLTHAVIDEALDQQANLIITHHPVLFRPAKRVTADSLIGNMLLRMAEARIALYCIHTNLDNATAGVSFALAHTLGLENVAILDGKADTQYKLLLTVSPPHKPSILSILKEHQAQAVHLSNDTETRAIRIAGTINRWAMNTLLAHFRNELPPSTWSYEVYPLVQKNTHIGLGAIGQLPTPEPLSSFLYRVSTRLKAKALRYVGEDNLLIERVAVCGGSGSSFVAQAMATGADAYVTADVTYHTWFNVFDTKGATRMALIDPGHYETEAMTEPLLIDRLQLAFPRVEWKRTRASTNPMKTFIPPHTS